MQSCELTTRHQSVQQLPLYEILSPRSPFSPRVFSYRKNSLSLKQKPIPLGCLEQEISRLDVVHDSLVHQTRAILDLMTGPGKHKVSSSNIHTIKAKEPFTSRTFNDKDNTCSTIGETKTPINEAKAFKTYTDRSIPRQSNEIQDTVEYQKWINKHKYHDNKENIPKNSNCSTPKQMNIFVKFVDKSCLNKTTLANRKNGKSLKPSKKRSVTKR